MSATNGKLQIPYHEFIANKMQVHGGDGFKSLWMPEKAFDFQKYCTEWNLMNLRDANFLDCGLGKSVLELTFAQNVVIKENKPVLIVCPLAVGEQMKREGDKFGVETKVSKDGKFNGEKIIITNTERIHYFNPSDFVGVVVDESSSLKAFEGKRRKQITRFMSKHKYRLMGTATAAPNDFIELGTHSEALGVMTQSEMLDQFFRSSDKKRHDLFKDGDFWNRAKYFFRAHSEIPFWRWVCSWARAARKPSDLGNFKDDGFILPPLIEEQIVIDHEYVPEGELFPRIARTLREQREERKRTLRQRCEKIAELVLQNPNENVVIWCHYNPEGELLEKLIPDSIEVAGRHSDEEKEEKLEAFSTGKIKRLITKQKIAGWGLNWQHVGLQIMMPSHSFEQYYQSIRRSWRFGRIGSVRIIIVTSPGEAGVTANLKKKQLQAEKMFEMLVREMNNSEKLIIPENHLMPMELPAWI